MPISKAGCNGNMEIQLNSTDTKLFGIICQSPTCLYRIFYGQCDSELRALSAIQFNVKRLVLDSRILSYIEMGIIYNYI